MTDKAYIVVNEEQEREVLKRLEKEGCSWNDTENTPPTEWHLGRYPYAIFVKDGKKLVWGLNVDVSEVEIVAEDKQDKVKISKEVYDALEDWKETLMLDNVLFIGRKALSNLPNLLDKWWRDGSVSVHESNNRLIAIIRWVNGEDVFEVEKSKKWVVRSKKVDGVNARYYIVASHDMTRFSTTVAKEVATVFDTEEEAKRYANDLMEVVETNE